MIIFADDVTYSDWSGAVAAVAVRPGARRSGGRAAAWRAPDRRVDHRTVTLGALLEVAGVGAVTSNLINNLPAYLVIEPEAAGGGPSRPWRCWWDDVGRWSCSGGSLATLLWRDRCKARGVEVSARHFAAMGLLGVPVVLVATTAALS